MTRTLSSTHSTDDTHWSALQQALTEEPDRPELLNAYQRLAFDLGKADAAQAFLDGLQRVHRWNHNIRRARIALCLHQKNHDAAMAAVETLVAFSNPDDGLIEAAMAIRAQLGPRRIDPHNTAKASISLCMIVRDEQAFLGPCLNSVKNLVDEIIVVDTGSKDRSADIATIYGAQVYHERWRHDFALARNISLEKAVGDWILILDADEAIAPQDFDALRRLATPENKSKIAFSIQTRNYIHLANAVDWHPNDRSYPRQEAGIGWFPTNKVRLFPNIDGIRFDYPVHEMVDARVEAAGFAIRSCPVPVHHYGHLNEAKNRRKAETYFELGYDKLDQLGDDIVALRELAVQAGQLGLWPQAIDLWQRLLALRPGYPEAYANLAGAHWQMGQYHRGIDASKKAIQANPDLKEGHYNLAVNLIMKGATDAAATVLERLIEKHGRYLPARFMLAAVHCISHQNERGRALFSALEREMTPQALSIAVADLVKKLEESGRSDDARTLKTSAGKTL
jgi:glycosyltransferase involved in cell wall biosynthesis